MNVYIAVVGSLNSVCEQPNPIKHISLLKYECEEFAVQYVKDHPGAEVNVFSWLGGERSYPSVQTEHIWNPNYNPPVVSTEVVDPEEVPPSPIHTGEPSDPTN